VKEEGAGEGCLALESPGVRVAQADLGQDGPVESLAPADLEVLVPEVLVA
jgi:hypothetical protein